MINFKAEGVVISRPTSLDLDNYMQSLFG